MSSDTDTLVDALSDGEYEYVSVDALHPHPKNSEVYGEIDPGESFIEDIRRNGVETPLIVNDHPDTEAEWDLPNTVIGGHRRLEGARRVGLAAVPVKWESYPEPLATRRLILNNLQREKNDAQLAREMLMLEDTARGMTRPRFEKAGGNNRLRPNLAEGGDGVRWDKEIADDVGVARGKVRYTTDVFRFADPDEYVHDDLQNPEKYDVDEEVRELAREKIEQMEAGEESAHSAYQDIKKAKNRAKKKQRREQNTEQFKQAVDEEDAATIDHGDFVDVLADTDTEYDHIITDPPYDEDAVAEWQKIATVAADVLKPGGLFAAYSGKYHLPDVYDALQSELEYFWQCVVIHDGGGARVWPRNIRTNYKPVLVFAKPPVEKLEDLGHDVIDGGGREKDDHEWQQATAEAVGLIDQLTEPNDLILDPMCGSGTTGVAALKQNRRVHLIDRDEEAVESARKRCADVI
jgi:site-specific DNA-methyltransferase (adenine-specific)